MFFLFRKLTVVPNVPLAVNSLFSGEERFGLCLDLYASHTQYNNLKHMSKRLQYLQYLDVLATVESTPLHSELSKECRHTREYEQYVNLALHKLELTDDFRYLAGLYNYLLSFSKRTQPLTDINALQKKAEEEFDQLWEEGKVLGWEVTKSTGPIEGIWCPACTLFTLLVREFAFTSHLQVNGNMPNKPYTMLI
jgi:splicing factor 3A subunit 3